MWWAWGERWPGWLGSSVNPGEGSSPAAVGDPLVGLAEFNVSDRRWTHALLQRCPTEVAPRTHACPTCFLQVAQATNRFCCSFQLDDN